MSIQKRARSQSPKGPYSWELWDADDTEADDYYSSPRGVKLSPRSCQRANDQLAKEVSSSFRTWLDKKRAEFEKRLEKEKKEAKAANEQKQKEAELALKMKEAEKQIFSGSDEKEPSPEEKEESKQAEEEKERLLEEAKRLQEQNAQNKLERTPAVKPKKKVAKMGNDDFMKQFGRWKPEKFRSGEEDDEPESPKRPQAQENKRSSISGAKKVGLQDEAEVVPIKDDKDDKGKKEEKKDCFDRAMDRMFGRCINFCMRKCGPMCMKICAGKKKDEEGEGKEKEKG